MKTATASSDLRSQAEAALKKATEAESQIETEKEKGEKVEVQSAATQAEIATKISDLEKQALAERQRAEFLTNAADQIDSTIKQAEEITPENVSVIRRGRPPGSRGRGRPPGSKNKRGRPPGAKNKVKKTGSGRRGRPPGAKNKVKAKGSGRRGRPPGSKNKTAHAPVAAKAKPKPKGKPKSKPSKPVKKSAPKVKPQGELKDLVIDVVKAHKGGIELKEILTGILATGYEAPNEEKFAQQIHDICASLVGDSQFVKDEESKKYKLKAA